MAQKERCLGCMREYEGEGECPYCGYKRGTSAESPLHMYPGTVLAERYVIGRAVGYGGFGVTYIGWDEILQQRVAIKEYLPSEFATREAGQSRVAIFSGNKAEQFRGGMEKFIEEARKLAKFQNEAGIVRVYDSFEANNTAYIIMEYLDGMTLAEYLKEKKQVPIGEAIKLLEPVVKSLKEVHKEGIIHRDIAPDNIMITKDGEVKLIDFGAARYATTSHSRSLTVIIKPGYSPEEQYRSRGDQGAHTDVYALGAVLYRMVTGVTPPDALKRWARMENKKKDTLEKPSKYCKLTKGQETAILNAMNVRIEDRTRDMAALWDELTRTSSVKRISGKIKAIDLMKWPLWAKIVIPAGGAAVVALLVLLFTGKLGFFNNLNTDYQMGEEMTRVPNVINYSVGVAQDKLERENLSSLISGREISETVPANMVLRQGVDAGQVVAKGTSIELYVSAAPEPTVVEGTMPDVMFYSEGQAREILEALGAEVHTEYEYSDDVAEGIVIRASVGLGEPLSEGDEVVLYVSKGKDPATIEPEPSESTEPPTGPDESEQTTTPTAPESTEAPPAEPVKVSRSSLSLYVGDKVNLTASGGNGSYSWSSNNPNVVSVNNGSVTATGRGSATITVTSAGQSATCSVTVQDYTLSLNESRISLFSGDSATLTATGGPQGTNYSWSSSNTSVATVNNGKVTANGQGSATITVSFTINGKNYSASCQVSVNAAGITLSQYSANLYEGETLILRANTSPSGQNVNWSSNNTSVATVNNGTITAKSEGSARITASFSYGGKSYTETCEVYVTGVSVSLTQHSAEMYVGDTLTLQAYTEPSDQRVSWSSNNTVVASVNDGRVTANGYGHVTITASITVNGRTYTDECDIYVQEVSITLSQDSAEMYVGDTLTLQAYTTPSGQRVSWSSSNTSAVTVQDGRIEAVAEGTATICAAISINGVKYESFCYVSVSAKTVIVTFDPVGGTVSTTSAVVSVGKRINSLPTPYRNGYVFEGWYTRTNGGDQVTTSTIITMEDNFTLYARWSGSGPSDGKPPENDSTPKFHDVTAYIQDGKIYLSGMVTAEGGITWIEISLHNSNSGENFGSALITVSTVGGPYAPLVKSYSLENSISQLNARFSGEFDPSVGGYYLGISVYAWEGNGLGNAHGYTTVSIS